MIGISCNVTVRVTIINKQLAYYWKEAIMYKFTAWPYILKKLNGIKAI